MNKVIWLAILAFLCASSYSLKIKSALAARAKVKASPTYIGCYTDGGAPTGLDLPDNKGWVGTVAECAALCTGYNYFGIQAVGCYCGNAYATTPIYFKVQDWECDMTGQNGANGYAGGVNRNAIYQLPDTNPPAHVDVTPAPIDISQYVGCYTDENEQDIGYTVGPVYSVAECAYRCGSDYNFFAMQNGGDRCFCGNAFATAPTFYKVQDWECNQNNAPLPVGSANRNAIYRRTGYTGPLPTPVTAPPVSKSQYIGCFTDVDQQDFKTIYGPVSSVAECTYRCGSSFNFFAVTYGGDRCFCGNTYATSPVLHQVADWECNLDNSELPFGGVNRNAVYRTAGYTGPAAVPVTAAPIVSSQWVGCYVSIGGSDFVYNSMAYSGAECQWICGNSKYFTMQDGRCSCGNTFSASQSVLGASSGECFHADFPSDYFGTGNRIAVYSNDRSSTSPLFAPTTTAPATTAPPAPVVVNSPTSDGSSTSTTGTTTSSSSKSVVSCPAGHRLVGKKCQECPPGHFSKAGDNECTQCKPGFYQPKSGMSSCDLVCATAGNSGTTVCRK